MLVSTKYLSLMQLVARSGRRPSEVEALAESRERAPPSLVESLPIPHHGFEAISELMDRPSSAVQHHFTCLCDS
jgi:hypothetical protein